MFPAYAKRGFDWSCLRSNTGGLGDGTREGAAVTVVNRTVCQVVRRVSVDSWQ